MNDRYGRSLRERIVGIIFETKRRDVYAKRRILYTYSYIGIISITVFVHPCPVNYIDIHVYTYISGNNSQIVRPLFVFAPNDLYKCP